MRKSKRRSWIREARGEMVAYVVRVVQEILIYEASAQGSGKHLSRREVCRRVNRQGRKRFDGCWMDLKPNDLRRHIEQRLGFEVDTTSSGLVIRNLFSALESATHYEMRASSTLTNQVTPRAAYSIQELTDRIQGGEITYEQALEEFTAWKIAMDHLHCALLEHSQSLTRTINQTGIKPRLRIEFEDGDGEKAA